MYCTSSYITKGMYIMKLESVKRTTLTGCYILENLKVITLLTAAWFIPFAAAIPPEKGVTESTFTSEKEVTENTFTSEEEAAESAFTSEERYSVAADNYGVLSHDLLGEQHDAYTGEVGFAQTDLIIPTNSDLKLKIKRIKGGQSSSSYKIFGDWSLDLPRLYGPIRANFHSGVDRCTTIGGMPPKHCAQVSNLKTTRMDHCWLVCPHPCSFMEKM